MIKEQIKNSPFYKGIATGEVYESEHSDDIRKLSNYNGRIVWMTPQGFLRKVMRLAQSYIGLKEITSGLFFTKLNPVSDKRVEDYSKQMKEGRLYPVPYYQEDDLTFNGVHRVLAAHLAGYKKIPIFRMKS